jgi:ABC-type multidrug transport system ATPase subunit
MNLTWQNISYNISKNKKILNNISGSINSKEMLCLLGSSGSGKTQTIEVLAGYKKNYTGDIYLNGNKIKKLDSSIVAYVPQNPILHPALTVLETLQFYNDLINKSKIPHSEILQKLESFGLL